MNGPPVSSGSSIVRKLCECHQNVQAHKFLHRCEEHPLLQFFKSLITSAVLVSLQSKSPNGYHMHCFSSCLIALLLWKMFGIDFVQQFGKLGNVLDHR